MTDGGGERDVLRFLTCGSVDSGKSTLIGRMLYDSKLIYDDHLEDLAAISETAGTVEGGIDFALLLDGLQAEREQGITIDVAYRYFSTPKRKFIVADAPGHEQYTRNMATGASTAQAAVMVVDVRKGILPQTRRHSFIAGLMGVDTVILAVNKMDLVDFDRQAFDRIVTDYRAFAVKARIKDVLAIPLAALTGDNVAERSAHTPWYEGPVFLEALESIEIDNAGANTPFRFPVQLVCRPDAEFRGFAGTVTGNTVKTGDTVKVFPSARESRIARIVTGDGDTDEARAGDAVTLVLDDDIDISRGDVIASADDAPDVTNQFAAHVIWMDEQPLIPERRYILKLGTSKVGAAVTELKHKVNVDTLEHTAAKTLEMNDIAFCNFALDRPIVFEPYEKNAALGGFILIDRLTRNTVGAGTIAWALRRATNVRWQELEIGKSELSALKAQKPAVLWLTGLSGAGKSTIANLVQKRLHALGRHTYILDGDNLRHGLNIDLGFVETDRVENVRRVAEVAKLFVDSGVIVLVSLISPYRQERLMARELVENDEFIEVFVDTPLEVCEERDPKGLYRKARAGELINFTGIDAPYEPPVSPDIRVDGGTASPETAAEVILRHLQDQGYLGEG